MSDAAILITTRTVKTLADGTLRLAVDIEPSEAGKAFELFGSPGTPAAIARLTEEAVLENQQQKTMAAFGQYAKELRLSSFFFQGNTSPVWPAIGSDCEYLAWLRTQPSAYSTRKGSENDPIQAAHVRRVSNGAGTGIKPKYSAIPLLASEHRLQHEKGESAVGGRDFFDKALEEHRQRWGWETLKKKLGYDHWNEVPPNVLHDWAEENNLLNYLPECYRTGF